MPVRVRLPDRDRFDPARLGTTLIRAPTGALVPLAAVAQPERANGQATLLRENLRQMALVTAGSKDATSAAPSRTCRTGCER